MTLVASHQPAFLPWLGLVNKLMLVDKFILTAGVKFCRDGYLNRVKLNGAWLTLPVSRESDHDRICDVRLADAPTKAITTLKQTLACKARPYRDRMEPFIESLSAAKEGDFLLDVNIGLIESIIDSFRCQAQLFLDISDPLDEISKTERLVRRVRRATSGPVTYLAGSGALDYLDTADLPRDWTLKVQSIAAGVVDQTSLVTLANEHDPGKCAAAAAQWRDVV